jgi:hypothetical protein
MTLTDFLTWFSTVVTLIGTGVAIWQARQARTAAKEAKRMRDEIAQRSQDGELSKLNGRLIAASRSMDKYGPGAGPNARRGASTENDAQMVRELTAELARHRSMLTQQIGAPIEETISKINNKLNDFAASSNETDRLRNGREIYNELLELEGNLKATLDEKLFR